MKRPSRPERKSQKSRYIRLGVYAVERKNIFIVYIMTDLNSCNTDDTLNFKLELFSIGALGLEFIGSNVWNLRAILMQFKL